MVKNIEKEPTRWGWLLYVCKAFMLISDDDLA